MGDRSNVFFVDGTDGDRLTGIYLYSHWCGTQLHRAAIKALNSSTAKARWSDEAYLARIIVHQVLDDLNPDHEETGFGLSTTMLDNEHDILVIDATTQQVRLMPEGEEKNPLGIVKRRLAFSESGRMLE